MALQRALSARHIAVECDVPQATSNPFWREAIVPALRRARTIVVAWSRHARASPWLDQEIRGSDAPHVWLLVDGTPVPRTAPRPARCARSVSEVADLVAAIEPSSSEAAGGPTAAHVEVAWRRSEEIDRGWELLRAATMHRAPPVRLRETGDGWLVDELSSTTFRRVLLDVYVATTSVTTLQYQSAVERLNLPAPPNLDTRGRAIPVVGVTWFEAMAVCHWFGGTLPSESTWQRAASVDGTCTYATGSGEIDISLAAYGAAIGTGTPVPQATYPPNASGFFGMCGNTWDWCRDRWGAHRVIRGGCSMDSERFCRATARYRNSPVDRDSAVGFRLEVRARKRTGEMYEAIRGGIHERGD